MSPERSFIGRQRELALLRDGFEAAACARAGIVLVAGEAGIGKTCLLRQMAAQTVRAGATVLWGDASEAEAMPPYLPFLEALGPYIQAAPLEQLRKQAGSSAGALVTILPELAARLGELPPSYPLPAEQARLRLYEAVGAFLAAIAADAVAGALLVLDDLQWADPASLDLLCYIARHQPTARLLLLGACREGEPDLHRALEQALNELARLRVLTTIALAPLSPEQVTALAAGHPGGTVAPVLCQCLHAQSEGNPFFAEELLRYWEEAGLLTAQDRGVGWPYWTLAAPPPGDLPPTISGAIRLRLARLPPPVMDVLRVAAIIGRAFRLALLARVIGREAEEIEDLLAAAGRAGLARDDGAGAFSFSHDSIRECLYSEVSSARRQRLHERIGCALEAWPDLDPAQRLAELAMAQEPEHVAWQHRLNSLAEEDPLCTSYDRVWHSGFKDGNR
jgi:predicted ATPase